jgi:hypothetical protein
MAPKDCLVSDFPCADRRFDPNMRDPKPREGSSMKGQFQGKVEVSLDLDSGGLSGEHVLVINERPISLRAVAAVSPAMLGVLEELAKPESDGCCYRVEREGDGIRLIKVGLMGHAGHKAGDMFQRRRIRA